MGFSVTVNMHEEYKSMYLLCIMTKSLSCIWGVGWGLLKGGSIPMLSSCVGTPVVVILQAVSCGVCM